MDEDKQGKPARVIGKSAQEARGSDSSSYPREQQYAPQYLYQLQQEQLQEKLNNFWVKQVQEIEDSTDFRTHSLPLARIKKIMKADEDVRMISAEVPVVFAKACEMFIQELTMRAWVNAEENKRRTLQKTDISSAISRTDVFDFLVDIVPRDDLMEHTSVPIENVPPYYYMPPHQHVSGVGPPYGVPRMVMGRPIVDQSTHFGQQSNAFATQMWPSPKHEENDAPNSDDSANM